MVMMSKITSKGQITLPKEVRKLLNVQEGNIIVFERENDKMVIKSAKTLRDFKGLLKDTKTEDEQGTLIHKCKSDCARYFSLDTSPYRPT